MSTSKKNEKDTLGQRMKEYERNWNSTSLDLTKPIYARIDGRHFSNFTKKFGFPYSDLLNYSREQSHNKFFDAWFFNSMKEVAKELLDEFDADIVETHSDEISLGWVDGHKIPFEGRYFKLISNIASYASSILMKCIFQTFMTKGFNIYDIIRLNDVPSFDCRIMNVPDMMELTNCFIWRQNDCIRGTINQYAQCWFSHKELHEKSINDRIKMLENTGHGDYLNGEEFERIKMGSFFKKETIVLPIDEKYKKYHPNETTMIRSIIRQIYPGRLSMVENKIEHLFGDMK